MPNSHSSLLTAITQMHLQSEKQVKDWHRRCAWSGAIAVGLFLRGAYPSSMDTRSLFVPAIIALFVAAFAGGREMAYKEVAAKCKALTSQ